MTGEELFIQTTKRDHDSWVQADPVTRESWNQRAAGEHRFIPSAHVNRVEEVVTVQPMPEPEHPACVITPSESIWERVVPNSAKIVYNRLVKHGWKVRVSYCRGPVAMQTQTIETESGAEEKVKWGQADSVQISARRGVVKLGAVWLAKPWLKEPGYKFHFGQARPAPGKIEFNQIKSITESEETP